jgi:hypothetical protein
MNIAVSTIEFRLAEAQVAGGSENIFPAYCDHSHGYLCSRDIYPNILTFWSLDFEPNEHPSPKNTAQGVQLGFKSKMADATRTTTTTEVDRAANLQGIFTCYFPTYCSPFALPFG